MSSINVEQLINDIRTAASDILNKDIATVKGFSERQLQALSQQAALVAIGIETKQITEETREFFLDGLKKMTQNFLDTLQGLLLVTIEKLWNAVVGVIWQAINGALAATGIMLPLPA